jgi:hypothetical protein
MGKILNDGVTEPMIVQSSIEMPSAAPPEVETFGWRLTSLGERIQSKALDTLWVTPLLKSLLRLS